MVQLRMRLVCLSLYLTNLSSGGPSLYRQVWLRLEAGRGTKANSDLRLFFKKVKVVAIDTMYQGFGASYGVIGVRQNAIAAGPLAR